MLKLFIGFLVLICCNPLLAQAPYGAGMNFNHEAYKKLPITAPLTRGDFDNLPKSVSLQSYAPTPGNQGSTGTCTAWSSAFHARTISESVKLNRTNQKDTDQNTFSPSYIYNLIREYEGCEQGTYIHNAMEVLKNYGVPKYSFLQFNCLKEIDNIDHQNASPYKIKDYKILFSTESNNKILPVKKSLSEKKPVVFGMYCPESFYNAKGVWKPAPSDKSKEHGGHAMVVAGYDDEKEGGSFLILNSWGKQWGNDGYMWVRYEDFNFFAVYGFEIIDEVSQPTVPFAGKLEFKLDNGQSMNTRFNAEKQVYEMDQAYTSGTLFRLYISNNEPAYVYAFGSDLSKKNFAIFPHAKNISPYLGYKENNVAIPDEEHYVRMDDTQGKDFFCVLYSKDPIDIDQVMKKMEVAPGNFKERLFKVLENQLVKPDQIQYENSQIAFKGSSAKASIVPVIVEIEHL